MEWCGAQVMLLDEASANVDLATDDALQETIRTQFASSTVPPLPRPACTELLSCTRLLAGARY